MCRAGEDLDSVYVVLAGHGLVTAPGCGASGANMCYGVATGASLLHARHCVHLDVPRGLGVVECSDMHNVHAWCR